MIIISGGLIADSDAQIISNGSFEVEPSGTTVVIGGSPVIDSLTFTDWRVFSVGSPPMAGFSATSVTNASTGNIAMQLDMVNTGAGTGADHGLDRNAAKLPVTYGSDYIIAFDAAWISGSSNLLVTLAEYDESGVFLGKQTVFPCSVSSSAYQQFAFEWTPLTNASATVNIAFRPKNSGEETSSSLLLDNVQFTDRLLAWSAGGLGTSSASFFRTNHLVATSVFHWYTPAGGQQDGPWLPLEGRSAWTGEPDWWRGQIKQMMAANIDVLFVHLIPGFEQQRINLFQALNQLRYEGYDVPKAAPFLDPVITWYGQPMVDVGTEAGKDEFSSQYIRFFNQYYSVNQDAYADDYLARFDNRVVLDTWVVRNNLTNIVSLTNQDVTSRLAGAQGAFHPVFSNSIYMVTGVAGPTLDFADEKIVQFENNDYFHPFVYNGIKTVQLKAGYWDQNIRTPGSFVARDGGLNFSNAWNQVDASIHRAYVESWNEYAEGTGIYAADPTNSPYIAPGNTSGNTDTWSSTDDPYEYIKATAAGAAAFNDIPDRDAKILWHDFPDSMVAGETQVVTVVVRNTGDASWTAAANYKFGDTADGAALFGASRYLIDDNEDGIPVYGGIFRGRPKAFQITLVAPPVPGAYDTHWGMLKEGVAWFGEQIAHTFTVTQTPYQAWAAGYFTAGELADPGVGGETADPDNDSFTNWEEYIGYTDPTDGQAFPSFQMQPETTVPDGQVYILSWASVSGRVYSVNWSPDLLQPFIPLQTNLVWPQSSYTDQTHQVEEKGFYRLEIRMP